LQWEEPKLPVAEEKPTDNTADTSNETVKAENTVAETEIAETVSVPAEPETAAVEFSIPAGPPPTETTPAETIAKTTVTPAAAEAEEPRWRVDDILLEPPRHLTDGKYGPGGADMTPYERFF